MRRACLEQLGLEPLNSPLALLAVTLGGLLIIAIDVACFQTTSDCFGELEPLVRHLKSCPPAAGFTEVLVPGESEFRARQDRLEQGIDIPEETWSKITRVAPPRT